MALGPEDKKKVYLLAGVAGLLGVAGLVLLRPSGDTATDPATNSSAPTTSFANPDGDATPAPSASGSSASVGGASGATAPVATASGVAGVPGAQLVAVQRFRNDPFEQFYRKPDPLPPPPPTPRPLPPIPPPLDIPPPPSSNGGDDEVGPYALPGQSGGATVASQALVGLPSARIPRLVNVPTAPRVQVAPPIQGGGSQPALERSGNKRLAGVVIGDSVRALLEVQDASASGGSSGGYPGGSESGSGATPPKTYIVQPGQDIPEEGIKVLRIERTNENGQTRVRMVVNENGVTRYIDLREGNRTATGGEGGYPGSSGSSGYSGGRPPGIP